VDSRSVEIGVLIAGGRSLRAGLDKRCLILEGQTLLARNLGFLRGLFPTVAVVIGHDQQLDLGDDTDADVLHDEWPGGSPLAGLATALHHFGRPVFALAADIAFPSRSAAQAVIAAFPGHDVAMPMLGPDRRQPLFAVYGPACLGPMVAVLDAGRHRIIHILPHVRAAEVRATDESAFRNINTIADFEAARTEASCHPSKGVGPRRPAMIALAGSNPAEQARFLDGLAPQLERLGASVEILHADESPRVVPATTVAPPADLVIVEGQVDLPWTIWLAEPSDAAGPSWSLFGPRTGATTARADARLVSPPADISALACFLAMRLDSLRTG
jgi:molybdopterin-guanine dinucleotide biosynthesis protein A